MTGDAGSRKVVVQRGLWFEEFETGVLYQHRPGRTITEADLAGETLCGAEIGCDDPGGEAIARRIHGFDGLP